MVTIVIEHCEIAISRINLNIQVNIADFLYKKMLRMAFFKGYYAPINTLWILYVFHTDSGAETKFFDDSIFIGYRYNFGKVDT